MRKLIQQHEFTIPTKQTTYPVDVFNMRSIKMLNSDKARLISSHKEYNEISLADQQNPRSVKLLEDFVSYTTEQLFSLTNISGGHIYTSWSQSNLHALYQYRNNNSYSWTKKILTSNHGHTSIVVAADMLWLELLVAYSPKEYYTHIKKHHESIAAVVITAWTTQLWQIEEMDYHLENLCQTYNIPIHIDAAYGWCNLGYHPRYNQQLTHLFNRPSVQSITIDFHKFVGENEVSLLLFRQWYMHKQSDAHNHLFLDVSFLSFDDKRRTWTIPHTHYHRHNRSPFSHGTFSVLCRMRTVSWNYFESSMNVVYTAGWFECRTCWAWQSRGSKIRTLLFTHIQKTLDIIIKNRHGSWSYWVNEIRYQSCHYTRCILFSWRTWVYCGKYFRGKTSIREKINTLSTISII